MNNRYAQRLKTKFLARLLRLIPTRLYLNIPPPPPNFHTPKCLITILATTHMLIPINKLHFNNDNFNNKCNILKFLNNNQTNQVLPNNNPTNNPINHKKKTTRPRPRRQPKQKENVSRKWLREPLNRKSNESKVEIFGARRNRHRVTDEEPELFEPDELSRPPGKERIAKSQRASNSTASSGSNPTMIHEMMQQQFELDRVAKMEVI
nr:hypothetical protein [Tanacetum cinerariifolium]